MRPLGPVPVTRVEVDAALAGEPTHERADESAGLRIVSGDRRGREPRDGHGLWGCDGRGRRDCGGRGIRFGDRFARCRPAPAASAATASPGSPMTAIGAPTST